ncbi:DUF1493 family protein [Yersinia enterocolitica]
MFAESAKAGRWLYDRWL